MVLSFNKYTRVQKRIGKEYPDKGYYKMHKAVEISIEVLFSSYLRNRRRRYSIVFYMFSKGSGIYMKNKSLC